MKTKKASLFIVVCAVSIIAGIFMGTSTGFLSGAGINPLSGESYTLAQLRGAEDCNCNDCTNDGTETTYECAHFQEPDPNSTEPIFDPNDPNSIKDDNNAKCSSTHCIKNTDSFAQCPTMTGGADCPMTTDANQHAYRQEIFDGAPAACSDPNYSSVDMHQECTGLYGTAYCVVGSCGGDKLPTSIWPYVEFHGNRYVCDQ